MHLVFPCSYIGCAALKESTVFLDQRLHKFHRDKGIDRTLGIALIFGIGKKRFLNSLDRADLNVGVCAVGQVLLWMAVKLCPSLN